MVRTRFTETAGRAIGPAVAGLLVGALFVAWPARADDPSQGVERAARSGDHFEQVAPGGPGGTTGQVSFPVEPPPGHEQERAAAFAFVGPFPEDAGRPWPSELTRFAECLRDSGLEEMPRNHAEVVALWETRSSGDHHVWRDGGIFFEMSDPVVADAYDSCKAFTAPPSNAEVMPAP